MMKKRKFEVESQSESDYSPRESEDKSSQVVLKQFMKSMKDHGEKIIIENPPQITYDLILSSIYSIFWGVLFIYISLNSISTCKVLSKADMIIGYFHITFAVIVIIYLIIAWWATAQKKIQLWKPLQRFINTFRLLQTVLELIIAVVLTTNIFHFSKQCDNEYNLINHLYILLQGILIGSSIFMLFLYSIGVATSTISKSFLKTYGSFSD